MNIFFNIAGMLQRSALRFPAHTAVEDLQGNSISYAALEAAANDLSTLLKEQGISFGSRVGLLAPKSISYISCMFAILKREAAYVPLDIQAPIGRNLLINRDCQLQALFIEGNALEELRKHTDFIDRYHEVEIDPALSLLVFEENKIAHEEQLAYILYTSGSTGSPKGVKHGHYSAYSFIQWSIEQFQIQDKDRIASHAPFHFDLSVFDIFASLGSGATMVLFDEKTASNPLALARDLSSKKISIFYGTPSVLSYLSSYGKMHKYSYHDLRSVLFAGEVFPINDLTKLKDLLPEASMYNLYGPTETNVCTWYKIPQVIPANQTTPFPIGETCSYASFTIIKTEGCTEREGELWIGGDSLMSGYWSDAAKTNTAFEIDDAENMWYRTGDIVCLNNTRELIFIRRKDRMIKRKGYRIELDEIEQHLRRHKSVMEVAVTANSPNGQTDNLVTAHVVWSKDGNSSSGELMEHCNAALPSYMLPDRFVFHESLPRTSTNKINYVVLSKA